MQKSFYSFPTVFLFKMRENSKKISKLK